jgi:hypothetical protein
MTDDPSRPGREPITVDLVDVDGRTEMTMTQSGANLPPEQHERTKAGWKTFFDTLEGMLTNPSR